MLIIQSFAFYPLFSQKIEYSYFIYSSLQKPPLIENRLPKLTEI